MIAIKVYSKSYTPLVTFLEGEYVDLVYRQALKEVGEASFTLDPAHAKVTDVNLRHYNRVEVVEDGAVRWSGYIARKTVRFTTVQVRCKSLIGLLKKRLVGSAYTLTGDAGQAAATLLSGVNAAEATGITFGTEDVSTSVNMTFERQDALSVLQRIAEAVGAQYEVTNGRQLNFKAQVGNDLSSSVEFRYNSGQVALANILSLDVEDDGDGIVTKAYGKSNALTSTQENGTLKATYGLLETFRDFRVANVQADVDALTLAQIRDAAYSPAINLAPSVPDNFETGDTVRVQIKNKLIDIDGSFQVLEKSVRVLGIEKRISVKISSLSEDFIKRVRDVEARLSLLETQV